MRSIGTLGHFSDDPIDAIKPTDLFSALLTRQESAMHIDFEDTPNFKYDCGDSKCECNT